MIRGVFPVEKVYWADVDANAVSLADTPVHGDAGALGHQGKGGEWFCLNIDSYARMNKLSLRDFV